MRLAAALVLMAGSAAAFAPAQQAGGSRQMALASTLEYEAIIGSGSSVSVGDFNAKLAANRETMSAKDKTSKSLGKSVSIFASKLNHQWHTQNDVLFYSSLPTCPQTSQNSSGVERTRHLSCVRCGMTATHKIYAPKSQGKHLPPLENAQCPGLCGNLDVGKATRELKFAVGVRDVLGSW